MNISYIYIAITHLLKPISISLLVPLSLVFCSPISVAANKTSDVASQINYAYANYLGTGIYTAEDRAVQVYHLPFRYTLREVTEHQSGIVLRLPATVGFLNFETLDLVDFKLPDSVTTFTFVPGIQLNKMITINWTVSPFIDSGIGYDFSTHLSSYVYGVGVKSTAIFDTERYQFTLFNELLYAGNTTPDNAVNNDFSRFETGLNFQFPLRYQVWDRNTAFSLYYLNFIYFNDLTFLKLDDTEINVSAQNEVGLTFDTMPDMKVSVVKFSRFGLGYRFGNGVNAVRLVFGMPF